MLRQANVTAVSQTPDITQDPQAVAQGFPGFTRSRFCINNANYMRVWQATAVKRRVEGCTDYSIFDQVPTGEIGPLILQRIWSQSGIEALPSLSCTGL